VENQNATALCGPVSLAFGKKTFNQYDAGRTQISLITKEVLYGGGTGLATIVTNPDA